jgi:hypothetical protein
MSSQQFRKLDKKAQFLRPVAAAAGGGGGGGGNASGSASSSLLMSRSKKAEGGGAAFTSSVSMQQQQQQPHSTRKIENHLLTFSNAKIPISVSSSKKLSSATGASSFSTVTTAATASSSTSTSSSAQPRDEDSSPIIPLLRGPSKVEVGFGPRCWCRCLLSLAHSGGSCWRVRRKLSEDGYIDIVGNIAETA